MSDISQININNTTYNIKDIEGRTQVEIMPTASADLLGKIYQFVGATGAFTNGYFYKCVAGETAGTYEWIPVAVQSGSGEQLVWIGTRAEHTTAEQEGTLPETAIIGITDESGGGGSDVIDDEHISTETTYSSSKIEELLNYVNITWEQATDEQIVEALALADAGEFSPANYWAVGDTRKFSLSAISPSTGVDETQPAQDIELVIVQLGLYKDENDKTVNAIVHSFKTLSTLGKMNTSASNVGSWDSCPRRTWFNSNFYNALPTTIRPIFKRFKTVTVSDYNASTLTTSIDYFALPAEKEIFGAKNYGTDVEANALTQWTYYRTSANRIKQRNDFTINQKWFLRTPYNGNTSNFLGVEANGNGTTISVNGTWGIAPFGCI